MWFIISVLVHRFIQLNLVISFTRYLMSVFTSFYSSDTVLFGILCSIGHDI